MSSIVDTPTDLRWYGKLRGALHAIGDDWVDTGLGACGADVRTPALTILDDAAFRQASKAVRARDTRCRKCLRKLGVRT